MRYSEIITETASEVKDILTITNALVAVIYKTIQLNIRYVNGKVHKDDPEDLAMFPGVMTRPARNKNWANDPVGHDAPRRFAGVLPDDAVEEYWDEMYSDVRDMLVGKHNPHSKHTAHVTAEIEVGTIDEILTTANFNKGSVDPTIYNMVKDIWIVFHNAGALRGQYSPNAKTPDEEATTKEEQMRSLQGEILLSAFHFIKNDRVAVKSLASVIAHEITHAIDDQKSNGNYMKNKKSGEGYNQDDMSQEEYLSSKIEVNARYTQAIKDLTDKIQKNEELLARDKFMPEMKRAFTKHKLTTPTISPQQVQQLTKRTLLHFDIK
jgi:hypothetical protein